MVDFFKYVLIFLIFFAIPYSIAMIMESLNFNLNLQILISNVFYIIVVIFLDSNWFIGLAIKIKQKHFLEPTSDNLYDYKLERELCEVIELLAISRRKTWLYFIYLLIVFSNILIELKIISEIPFQIYFESSKYGIILLISVDRIISNIEKCKVKRSKYKPAFEEYSYRLEE